MLSWFERVSVVAVGTVAGIFLAGGLVLVLAVAMFRGVGDSPLGEVDAGFTEAADFTLPSFDGEPFTLSDHSSGPVFVYFWASWCGPCFREAPLIERLWPEFEARGYMFVGVNILDSEGDARAFIKQFELTFPMVIDEGGTYLDYGVVGLPEGFFLRPGLGVNRKFIGELTEGEFRRMLDELTEGS
jgi:cytochrome c biogenesis protein CcmG/thiol:disulfide interchange protein DsbE